MAGHPASERLEQLNKRKEQALNAGSESARERQHSRGKMLARERVEYLLDEGSFHELDLLARTRLPEATDRPYTDGVITGWGTVDGRKVFIFDGTSYMFITGPDVVKTVTGEEVTQQELGGAVTHASKSGVCQFISSDDKACLDDVRYLLSFLPANNLEDPPVFATTDDPNRRCPELIDLIPASSNMPYDMHKVVEAIVDDGEFFEYAARWAPNILCCFARMDGHPVGIVGNQPMHLAGVLDIESSEKAARFVRTCDAFNIPLLTFVDVPGFLPGVDQEYGGIMRHGARLLYAYCEATVPRIQIVVRKAYGGAYVVMNSKSIGADLAFAWPSAELAVMG